MAEFDGRRACCGEKQFNKHPERARVTETDRQTKRAVGLGSQRGGEAGRRQGTCHEERQNQRRHVSETSRGDPPPHIIGSAITQRVPLSTPSQPGAQSAFHKHIPTQSTCVRWAEKARGRAFHSAFAFLGRCCPHQLPTRARPRGIAFLSHPAQSGGSRMPRAALGDRQGLASAGTQGAQSAGPKPSRLGERAGPAPGSESSRPVPSAAPGGDAPPRRLLGARTC
jgi:hypothetical protein